MGHYLAVVVAQLEGKNNDTNTTPVDILREFNLIR